MKIIIKTKSSDLSEELKSYVEEKISGLKKFIDVLKEETPDGMKTLAEVFVEIEKETEHHKKGKIFLVKIQVFLPGKSLMAQHRADDLIKAVGGAKEELKREIEKYKFKKIDKIRGVQRKIKEEM